MWQKEFYEKHMIDQARLFISLFSFKKGKKNKTPIRSLVIHANTLNHSLYWFFINAVRKEDSGGKNDDVMNVTMRGFRLFLWSLVILFDGYRRRK